MAKYSYELKMKVVQAYLDGEGSYDYLVKKYNIPDKHMLRLWVKAYKELGNDGSMRSRQNKNYSFRFKVHIVVANILNGEFDSDKSMQKVVTDVTYIKHKNKWYYQSSYG